MPLDQQRRRDTCSQVLTYFWGGCRCRAGRKEISVPEKIDENEPQKSDENCRFGIDVLKWLEGCAPNGRGAVRGVPSGAPLRALRGRSKGFLLGDPLVQKRFRSILGQNGGEIMVFPQ